jgi:hypothetical protein
MSYVVPITPTDPGPSCDIKNANSTTYNACEWGYLGGDPTAYGPAKPYADQFCAVYYPKPASIQDTSAYKFCQDGVQHAHQQADCSQSSSLDSKIACDYGYWYDNHDLTFSHGSIYVNGDQQKAQAAADQACNSTYHS